MAAALAAQQEAQRTMQAVVKLFVRSVDTSYTSPWQKMDAATGTGSGSCSRTGRQSSDRAVLGPTSITVFAGR